MASFAQELALAPVVAVDEHGIFLNGAPVGDELYGQLTTLKNNFALLHPSEHFDGAAIVVADRDLGFAEIKRVMESCARAGYLHVHFLVQRV